MGFVGTGRRFRPGVTTGNTVADLLLRGTAFQTAEVQTNTPVQQRWNDFEFYIADSYKASRAAHRRRRRALLATCASRTRPRTAWRASTRTRSTPTSQSPVQRPALPPGENPCPALGLAGGADGPNRSLRPTKSLLIAPRLGFAWDVNGDGKTALRGGLGLLLQPRAR